MTYLLDGQFVRRLAWRRLAAVVAGLVACLAPPAWAAFPGTNGRIAYGVKSGWSVFAGEDYEQHALYAVQPDGDFAEELRSCVRPVTAPAPEGNCSISFHSPAYSPDGTQLVFDAGGRLGFMYSDGSGPRILSQATGDDGETAWSPSGRRVAFTGTSAAGERDVWLVRPSGGGLRRLTHRGGLQPAWSSRGRIAFVRGGDIHTVRPDGSGLRRITPGSSPAWSPDAARLAFVRGDDIYSIRPNGRGLRRLLRPAGPGALGGLAWSPDGKQLAFEVRGCERGGIFVMRLARRDVVPVSLPNFCSTSASLDFFEPDWQPLR